MTDRPDPPLPHERPNDAPTATDPIDRGRALLAEGRPAEAVEVLAPAYAGDASGDRTLALTYATACHLSGDHRRAIDICLEVDADHLDPDALELAGEAEIALGYPERARDRALRALQVAPDDPAAWYTLAGGLFGTGDLAAARTAVDHAIGLDQDLAAAWWRGGAILDASGAAALAAHYRAAAIARGAPGGVADHGDLPAIVPDPDDVEDARLRSLDDPKVGRDRFTIALALGATDLALAHANWLVRVEPDPYGDIAAARGELLAATGDRAGARESFAAALRKAPAHPVATAGLARLGPAAARPAATASTRPQAVAPTARQPRGLRLKQVVIWAWMLFGFTASALVLWQLVRDDNSSAEVGPPSVTEPAPPTTMVPEPPGTTPSAKAAATTSPPSSAAATAAEPAGVDAPSTAPAPTAPATTLPATLPPTTLPATTAPPATTAAPATTQPLPAPTAPPATLDPFGPAYFASPDEALADWLSLVSPPYEGTCDSLAGREVELGGAVTCAVLDHELGPAQVYRWGVFATDDLRGWILVDVGSAGWSVADETFELTPPW